MVSERGAHFGAAEEEGYRQRIGDWVAGQLLDTEAIWSIEHCDLLRLALYPQHLPWTRNHYLRENCACRTLRCTRVAYIAWEASVIRGY